LLGTYGYMSPEQRAGERVDARTDIYSMAVMVAETLTNCRPPRFGASGEWLASVLPAPESAPVLGNLMSLSQAMLGRLFDGTAERRSANSSAISFLCCVTIPRSSVVRQWALAALAARPFNYSGLE